MNSTRFCLVTFAVACTVMPRTGALAQMCTDCVVADTLVRLDFTDTRTYPSPNGFLARQSDGGWLFVDPAVRYELLRFGPTGSLERTIGRWGEGPGEYADAALGISGVVVDATDRLWVFSLRGRRLDLYDDEFDLIRSVTLDVPVQRAAPLADGRVAAVVEDPGGSAGVVLIDENGEVRRLTELDLGDSDPELVSIASDSARRFWVTETHSFRIWEYASETGVRLLTDASPAWSTQTFSPAVREEFGAVLDTRGATILWLSHDAEHGLLWLAAGVPSSTIDVATIQEAYATQNPNISGLLVDYAVDAIDLQNGARVATGQFDELAISGLSMAQYVVVDSLTIAPISFGRR